MATRIEKLLWSVLCGTAIGLAGCYESDPPKDASEDAVSDAEDPLGDIEEEEPIVDLYGAPMYGSP
ncbi:MAG: hypothetical protein JRG91_09910 [Deltaproteobacteria bacterium]|nr:hypothetical protein [Deltaproteobacteria bacterium]